MIIFSLPLCCLTLSPLKGIIIKTIHIITTGGTIDKAYNPLSETINVLSPVIDHILLKSHVQEATRQNSELFNKDSNDLTDEDRTLLCQIVLQSEHQHFLITHGTDTMHLTAQALHDSLTLETPPQKVIVITGSLTPYSMNKSDAPFNIGFAFAAAQFLTPGIYIAMHGLALPFQHHQKNKTIGRFIYTP